MRVWMAARTGRLVAVVALAVIVIGVTALLLLSPMLAGAHTSVDPVSDSSSTPTPTPSLSNAPRPTPSASPTVAHDAALPPGAAVPQAPTAPKPAPAPVGEPPAIISMNPAPFESCGEFPSGQTVHVGLSWGARDGNTVDIYYAYTDGDYQATSGFVLHSSGLPTTGSVQIPRTCPNGEGALPRVTIKLVANNSIGSGTSYYWGL